MNTKHTPGPWTISPSAKASTLTRIFSSDEGRLIASANGPGLSESGEAEANARLIAAAPELLEALERNVNRMCYAISFTKKESKAEWELSQAIDEARAAIAKATGNN